MNASSSVWDPLVRIIHWALVLAFTLNYFILEPGNDSHQIIGYCAVALVLTRVVWGVIGSTNARFSSFVRGPGAVIAHLREFKQPPESGHNPAAGWMILLLLILVASLGVTGFLMQEVDYFWGNQTLEVIHSWMADTLFVAVLIHIAAAVIFSIIWRRNLIRSMVTGKYGK
ncbi:cytochrome b/b6 domain-containing protein [Pseudidiomarina taiwanensis]|uniref:Cytochrome B n=1 Tax=Pseudidiomarina taiwanensis TaxID=337250 RepID=A0A432ZKL6_9GAMM|nr:cytochrome b/b6 domain-containing protein [Pseudidiomarina taiwanensis]RUO78380.1 cytochrome B [Pseudidiomarina taiwanensis]